MDSRVRIKPEYVRSKFSPIQGRINSAELVADYEKWQSVRKVAEKHNIDRKTATAYLKKAGVVLRLPGYPKPTV